MCVFNCSDAVLDAVGRKTDIRLLKVFQAEIKPNRHEARIVVCLVRMLLLASVFCVKCLLLQSLSLYCCFLICFWHLFKSQSHIFNLASQVNLLRIYV